MTGTDTYDCERRILSSSMLNEERRALFSAQLVPDDFSDIRNIAAWSALLSLQSNGETVDSVAMARAMESSGVQFDAFVHLLDCHAVVGTWFVPPQNDLDRVLQASHARKVARSLAEMQTLEDPAEIAAAAEALAKRARPVQTRGAGVAVSEVAQEVWRKLQSSEPPSRLTSTGLPMLDDKLGGGLTDAMHIVAARPGQGKTALATQIAVNVALSTGRPVPFFCVEMDNADQLQRIVSQRTAIPVAHIRGRRMSPQEHGDVGDCLSELSGTRLQMCDLAGISAQRIVAECIAQSQREPLGIIVIDYFQRIRWDGKIDKQLEALERMSGAFADLARQARCPVLLLAQLNREMESEKRRPRMSDLKGCGQLEQDAHTIICPFLPRNMGMSNDPAEAEIIIAKNRTGPTMGLGKELVRWNAECVRFEV